MSQYSATYLRTHEREVIGKLDLITIFQTIFSAIKTPSGLASFVFDVLIITIFLYKILEWTKETRAFQVMKGIGLLFVFSVLARLLNLWTIYWVLNSTLAGGSIFIILFILFTPEIRRMLSRIGTNRLTKLFGGASETDSRRVVMDLKRSILHLAKRRVGALIVFERRSGLGDIAATFLNRTRRCTTAQSWCAERPWLPQAAFCRCPTTPRSRVSSGRVIAPRWGFLPRRTAWSSSFQRKPARSPLRTKAS